MVSKTTKLTTLFGIKDKEFDKLIDECVEARKNSKTMSEVFKKLDIKQNKQGLFKAFMFGRFVEENQNEGIELMEALGKALLETTKQLKK